MAGSQSHRGHRHREDQGGPFWNADEEFVKLTVEMLISDALRSLTPLERNIWLDTLCHYWHLSRGDTERLKEGFYHTFKSSRIDCSHSSFRKAMHAIESHGWFTKVNGDRIVSRYRPGPWRDYQDDTIQTLRSELKRQPRITKKKTKSKKTKKATSASLGNFWIAGQAFVPIPYSILECDAWRILKPTARCILLDMIVTYHTLTRGGYMPVDGITYGVKDCRVACSENSFYEARAAIVKAGWFTTPHEIQKGDGTILFTPGPWRKYVAPIDAQFRKTAQAKTKYLALQQSRQLKKPTPKNWSVQPPKIGAYGANEEGTLPPKIVAIGENKMNRHTPKNCSGSILYHSPTPKLLKLGTIRRILPVSSSYCPLCCRSVGKIVKSVPENGASSTSQLQKRKIS